MPMEERSSDRAVIFDMDGVLIDSYRAHYESWRLLAAENGREITEQQFAAGFGRTSREIIAEQWSDLDLDAEQIARLDARKEEIFRKLIERDFPAMPGAADLIRALKKSGFLLAVGSSGPPENVKLVLEKLQVEELVDAVVTGAEVTRGKPDPEVFLLAAAQLGVQPARCVVIEDAPAGVEAAHAAGMPCIALVSTGRRHEELAAAERVVTSLRELTPETIAELLQQPP